MLLPSLQEEYQYAVLYQRRKRYSQASENDAPLACTKASQVENPVRCAQLWSCPGSPVEAHTSPAQSPLYIIIRRSSTTKLGMAETYQSVVSKIIECWLKNWKGLQDAAGHLAWGIPHPLGSGDPAVISEGTELLEKKYTAIPELSHCTTSRW